MSTNVLRLPDVRARTGLSRSTIYELLAKQSGFPQPVRLAPRCIGFLESEIDDWIQARADERPNVQAVLP